MSAGWMARPGELDEQVTPERGKSDELEKFKSGGEIITASKNCEECEFRSNFKILSFKKYFSVRPDEVGAYLKQSKCLIIGSHLRIYVSWRTEVCASNAFI